jgi:hypothetical protein
MLLPLLVLHQLLELLVLLHVDHVVYVDRDALALVRVLQQVPSQHALHVNQ